MWMEKEARETMQDMEGRGGEDNGEVGFDERDG